MLFNYWSFQVPLFTRPSPTRTECFWSSSLIRKQHGRRHTVYLTNQTDWYGIPDLCPSSRRILIELRGYWSKSQPAEEIPERMEQNHQNPHVDLLSWILLFRCSSDLWAPIFQAIPRQPSSIIIHTNSVGVFRWVSLWFESRMLWKI